MFAISNMRIIHFRPTYATPKVLEKAGLTLADIDAFEFHEAFAVREKYTVFACVIVFFVLLFNICFSGAETDVNDPMFSVQHCQRYINIL